ncbi:MAG: polyprenol monophosphomannose synthase [Acidimicrobiales bacterium]
MRPLVVLPTYQEAADITTVLRCLRAVVPSAAILVVDDASPDGTADLADAVAREMGGIEVLRRPGKAGLGSAYRDGFRRGLARDHDAFVEMDADLSHDPAALPSLLAPLIDGADLVVGSRYIPGGSIPDWGLHRRLLSRWGNRYAVAALGLSLTDATSGFRVYRREALAALDLESVRAEGYGFQIEMAYRVARNGGRIVEVPITFAERARGASKMSGRVIAEALALVAWWALRDRLPRGGRRPHVRGSSDARTGRSWEAGRRTTGVTPSEACGVPVSPARPQPGG